MGQLLPENSTLARRLRRAAAGGALPHAIIFSGSGDRMAAARFAAAAMECEAQSGKPCLQCRQCRKVLEDIHPDVQTVQDPDHRELPVDLLRRLRQTPDGLRGCVGGVIVDGEGELYEDDGYSYGYENGEYATTALGITDSTDAGFALVIGERKGTFPGRERRPDDRYKESDPVIPGIGEVVPMRIVIEREVSSVTLDGENVAVITKDGRSEFALGAKRHEAGEARFEIKY